jgi:hypothetical protein
MERSRVLHDYDGLACAISTAARSTSNPAQVHRARQRQVVNVPSVEDNEVVHRPISLAA